ncbi:MAG TPA: hypothetical protein VFX28_11210, partial [Methylomirabilota bacterium]|nr:hypothetical protein [Methylomirabilota bacterium]
GCPTSSTSRSPAIRSDPGHGGPMTLLLDALVTAISLVFLGILGLIAGVAVPGLFIAVVAPFLDKLLPAGKKR